MSRSVRAAGLVLGGIEMPSPDDFEGKALDTIASYVRAGIGAFLFPGAAARQRDRFRVLVEAARRAVEEAGLGKALIAVGGNLHPSFGLPFVPFVPTQLGLASTGSLSAARRAGGVLGSFLAGCGADLVLGPRLDLASDPKDPAGVLDGFGEDSRLAGRLGAAYARGLARAGLSACVGRFPGLGAVCSDCYEGMGFIALPVERLERCEMRPFATAIKSGAAAVLVGRVLVPSLEAEHIPASASARVIEGRLRERLGFGGLVIGDDIGAGEDPGKAAILGALAGCDLCLFSRSADALAAAAALDKAASSGELPAIRIVTARRRAEALLRFRRRARLPAGEDKRKLGHEARDVERGISLIRGSLRLDAAESGDFGSVLVLAFLPPPHAPDAGEAEGVVSLLKDGLPGATVLAYAADPGEGGAEELARALERRDRFSEAAILTYDAHFRPAQEGMARLVEEALPRFRVVAMRDPYDAAFFPKAVGLGASYGFSAFCAKALASVLSGKAKARGGHPVEVIGLEV
jgi:beta-N-acetylhexosaminidase